VYSSSEILARLRAFAGAIAVHVLMAALVVLGTMNWQPFRKSQPVGLTIEAVIVDTGEIKKQRDAARQAVEREERRRDRDAELEKQRQREQERQLEEEQQRQAEQQRQQQRQQELEAQRKREAEDRLQQLRIERERKLEDERLRQQRELEKAREQSQAAEKQRKLEEERLKQIEARKASEREDQLRQQQAAEAQRQAEAEAQQFRAGQMATLNDQYVAAIATVVTNNWLRPPTAQPGLNCKVKVVQIPGGEVISSSLSGRCNGDEATRRSILAAVDRAGVLPYRGYEDVFQREIEFTFRYDGD
jgi:colicin import membrane protein